MKAKCPDCGEMIGVTDGNYDNHGECAGGGKAAKMDDGRVRRFDYVSAGQLRKPVRMDNGWLKTEGRIARVGIQEYRDSTGEIKRELRLPEEVFDRESLDSFQQLPVTNQHPPEMLNSANAKKYTVGNLGENIRKDGDFVVASILLHDADAIAAAEAGRSQLSNGYSCSLDGTQDRELTARWGKYDFIQRNIRGNHCAMVDFARAGNEARMRLDSGDAISGIGKTDFDMLRSESDSNHSNRAAGSENVMLHSLKFDGLTYEVTDQNAQPQLDRYVAGFRKQYDELLAKYDALAAQMKTDAAEMIEFDGAKIAICDLRDEKKRAPFLAASVTKAANERADLIVEARKHVSANEKLDGLSNVDIKKLVAQTLNKEQKLDDKSPEYIQVLYDLSIAAANKNKATQVDIARGAAFLPPTGNPAIPGMRADQFPSTDPAAARQAMIQRELAANVKSGNGAR